MALVPVVSTALVSAAPLVSSAELWASPALCSLVLVELVSAALAGPLVPPVVEAPGAVSQYAGAMVPSHGWLAGSR